MRIITGVGLAALHEKARKWGHTHLEGIPICNLTFAQSLEIKDLSPYFYEELAKASSQEQVIELIQARTTPHEEPEGSIRIALLALFKPEIDAYQKELDQERELFVKEHEKAAPFFLLAEQFLTPGSVVFLTKERRNNFLDWRFPDSYRDLILAETRNVHVRFARKPNAKVSPFWEKKEVTRLNAARGEIQALVRNVQAIETFSCELNGTSWTFKQEDLTPLMKLLDREIEAFEVLRDLCINEEVLRGKSPAFILALLLMSEGFSSKLLGVSFSFSFKN
jgi:hypothetical protein